MLYNHRFLPMCLVTLVTLTACVDDSTILTVEALEPGGDEAGPTAPRLTPNSMEVEGYATQGELRIGFIYDREGEPLEVTYEIHDGLAIWQGDIVIGTPDRIATSLAELTMTPGPLRGVVIARPKRAMVYPERGEPGGHQNVAMASRWKRLPSKHRPQPSKQPF